MGSTKNAYTRAIYNSSVKKQKEKKKRKELVIAFS